MTGTGVFVIFNYCVGSVAQFGTGSA